MAKHSTAKLAAPACAVNWRALDLADEDCPGRPAEAVIWQQCGLGHFTASLACPACIAVMASLCDFGDYGCGQCAHEGSYRRAALMVSALASAPEPIGWIVATEYSDGSWHADSDGMWPTPEDAQTERADLLRDNVFGKDERLRLCAVVPVEDGQHG